MKILNVWQSSKGDLKYFEIKNKPVFRLGDYAIYTQFYNCYLHTYKNISINQLCGINKEHLTNLLNNTRPTTTKDDKNNVKGFLFDRAKETLKKGLELI